MAQQPIGVIDSGVGGLSVLRALQRRLPARQFVYVCDQAHVPYGTKSKAVVRTLTWRLVRQALACDVQALVIGCNTITALMLAELTAALPIPVFGIIEAGSQAANQTSQTHTIGVIGTERTIQERAYVRALHRESPRNRVVQLACQPFVSMVENLPLTRAQVVQVDRQLAGLKTPGMDTVVLGCTHFPLMRATIQEALGPAVQLVDPAITLAAQVAMTLEGATRLARQPDVRHDQYYTTGQPERLAQVAMDWLAVPVEVRALRG